jgi:uncharacterized membrane protein
MVYFIAGLLLFFGMHSVGIFAPATRDRAITRLGDASWKGLFTLVSIIGFVMLVHGYGVTRAASPVLYTPPQSLRYLAALLMLPVFPLLLATYLPGRIKAAVQHPMLTATKAWALAHLLVNGTVVAVLLFGSFLVWAVLDRIAAGRRAVQRRIPAAPASNTNDIIAIAGGLLLYIVFIGWAHQRLFGVAPLLPTH